MMRVLFVDDDKDTSELFKKAGEFEDVDTVVFTEGADALRFLEHNSVDVVVLDLQMPVLDGLTIAEQIRLNEENQPHKKRVEICFVTGYEISSGIQRVADRVGVKYICKKPCDMVNLLHDIKGWAKPQIQVQGSK